MKRTYDKSRGDYIRWSEMKATNPDNDIYLELATPDAETIKLATAMATPDAQKLLNAKDKRDAESEATQ